VTSRMVFSQLTPLWLCFTVDPPLLPRGEDRIRFVVTIVRLFLALVLLSFTLFRTNTPLPHLASLPDIGKPLGHPVSLKSRVY
jgi:hypothetical protein